MGGLKVIVMLSEHPEYSSLEGEGLDFFEPDKRFISRLGDILYRGWEEFLEQECVQGEKDKDKV